MTTDHAAIDTHVTGEPRDHAAVEKQLKGQQNDHSADIDKHVRVYIMVFVALMALTIVTVAISYLDLSPAMAITLALFVATIKGSLVACYFMHLISEKRLIYFVLVITAVKFVALLALPVFTHSNGYWIEP